MTALEELPDAIANAELEVGDTAWPDGTGTGYNVRFARLSAVLDVLVGNDDMNWAVTVEHAVIDGMRYIDPPDRAVLRERLMRATALMCVWIDQIDGRPPSDIEPPPVEEEEG